MRNFSDCFGNHSSSLEWVRPTLTLELRVYVVIGTHAGSDEVTHDQVAVDKYQALAAELAGEPIDEVIDRLCGDTDYEVLHVSEDFSEITVELKLKNLF